MRNQLIQYVDLLFAGISNCDDARQEILQNTLERYDDLIGQGKSPEAAYRLAISGIGDINEILDNLSENAGRASQRSCAPVQNKAQASQKQLRTLAIGLYIVSPVPLFLFSEWNMSNFGLCLMLILIAAATMLLSAQKSQKKHEIAGPAPSPSEGKSNCRKELRTGIHAMIWAIGLAIYLILSFRTKAWFITWLVFPITGAVKSLIRACMDLMEV